MKNGKVKPKESEFAKHIRLSPSAHKLSIAMNMAGIHTDIPTAHLILQVQKKVEIMKGKFDLETACKLRVEMINKFFPKSK